MSVKRKVSKVNEDAVLQDPCGMVKATLLEP